MDAVRRPQLGFKGGIKFVSERRVGRHFGQNGAQQVQQPGLLVVFGILLFLFFHNRRRPLKTGAWCNEVSTQSKMETRTI
jgi:hypothetical protein